MRRSMNSWQLMGFGVTSLLGTLLHFLYDWLDKAVWIAPFSSVNESTWEHMKLLFWPMILFALVESFFFKDETDFWCVKLKGILLGLFVIPTLFYTYNGVIGKSPDWINIAIFFVAAAVSFIYESKMFKQENKTCVRREYAFLLLCFLGVLFVIFTFKTPEIGVFRDPVGETYGI